MSENTTFTPDWVSPPGDTIAAILDERGLTRAAFAKRIGRLHTDIEELICGHAVITAELAQFLADELGSTATFWTKREARYRRDLKRLEREASSSVSLDWLGSLPAKEMAEFGWIRPVVGKSGSAAACLQFFGVPTVNDWQEAYKDTLQAIALRTSKAFASKPGAVAAWLRQAEIQASEIDCGRWDPKRFRNELVEIRALTREKDQTKFVPELTNRCAACGVAVVLLRAPKMCKASGAARFLAADRPMLLLSGRHLSDDHFWFTFYHEAGHLILHSDKLIFVDGLGDDDNLSTREEEEANQFATDQLIPPEHQAEMLRLTANKKDVMRFAMRIGISRGVVVGQLQHRGIIGREQLNSLKHWFRWADR
jgi:Zn-dependent peptidase ImmA (M78 family)/plasmid maintenance system antidote protein VapI